MKKYIKPSIEIVEANLSADCLQGGASRVYDETADGPQLAPGKKGSYEEDDYEDDDFGW